MATRTDRNQTFDMDGKLVHEEIVEVPETAEEAADREFRAAVEAATSIADIKAALLGTTIGGRPVVRPK